MLSVILNSKNETNCLDLKTLNTIFHADPKCSLKTDDDIFALQVWIRNALEYMAMTDYPYPTNFLMPMQAWPATVSFNTIFIFV